MHLRCKVCEAVQPVNTADPEDEDPRTQGIRRDFRREHVASCGVGSVSLILYSVEALYVDPEIWNNYKDSLSPPEDVMLQADGFFSRSIHRDGQQHQVRVCEDCWQNIPRYIDYPAGLISPESDGANGAIPKWKPITVETDSPERATGVGHLWRAVCVPCYRAAFARVYPDAQLAPMSEAMFGDGAPVTPAPPVAAEAIGRVTMTRWDK